jgi:hypothetical protein
MRVLSRLLISLLFLGAVSAATAGTVSGTVRNGTTGKPVSGADIILLSLQNAMDAVASTKTGPDGHFRLEHPAIGQQPMLLRAVYEGVNYHQSLPPGQTDQTVTVDVFEATADASVLHLTARLIALQPNQSVLLVGEEYRLTNRSQPPQAYFRPQGSFTFALPQGAELAQVDAAGPSGMPVVQGTQELGNGRYSISFPFRPGDNSVRISYHVPYTNGQATIQFPSLYTTDTVMVLVPPGVQLLAEGFQPAGSEQGWNVFVRQGLRANDTLRVSLSGQGSQPPSDQTMGQDQSQGQGNAASPAASSTVVVPPLQGLRTVLLVGFAGIFALGVLYLWMKWKPARQAGGPVAGEVERGVQTNLEELKDRLFRIELRYQAGTLSEEEYRRQREQTLQALRALVRE